MHTNRSDIAVPKYEHHRHTAPLQLQAIDIRWHIHRERKVRIKSLVIVIQPPQSPSPLAAGPAVFLGEPPFLQTLGRSEPAGPRQRRTLSHGGRGWIERSRDKKGAPQYFRHCIHPVGILTAHSSVSLELCI
jgi:hypothetical protein